MMSVSSRSQKIAQIGIVIEFTALIRCMGEYFRLKYFAAESFSIAPIEAFLTGALVFAVIGILFYFGVNYKTTGGIAVVNAAILLALRFILL